MIQLADQAEAYINHQESERARNPESVSHDQYDVNQSRKEWLDEVNHGV